MRPSERQQVLQAATDIVARALPQAWAIYVYGSFARADERAGSDLDLAILLPPGSTLPDKLGLIAAVSEHVRREVDIVDLRNASQDLIHELLKEGQQLRVTMPSEVLAWEAQQMSTYAEFNPRRAEIVARYMKEPLT